MIFCTIFDVFFAVFVVVWVWFLQDVHTKKQRLRDRATVTYSTRATFGAKLKEGPRPLPLAALPQIPCQGKGLEEELGANH